MRLFSPEGARGDKNKPIVGEEGGNFGQENGSTEGSCLVNMILCYMNIKQRGQQLTRTSSVLMLTCFNYKGFLSMILLALSDADYKFIWVSVADQNHALVPGVWRESVN